MNSFLKALSTPTIFVLLLGIITGCDSGSDNDDAAPPVFSRGAFFLETELFSGVGGKNSQTGLNFISAAARVGSMTTILAVHTAIPGAITTAALQANPTFSDGIWTWTRTISHDDRSLEFSLTAKPGPAETEWAMTVSMDDQYLDESYSDYNLFTGLTKNNGSSGSWELYYKVGGIRTKVLTGSFNQPDEDTGQVTYRIPATAESGAGDTVLYQADGIQRSFFWTQVQASLTHDIRWNTHNSTGSIRSGNYRNGTLSCWDVYFDDAGCPSS